MSWKPSSTIPVSPMPYGRHFPSRPRVIEDGVEVVGTGDLGYWPPGKAFCIFFGPTPISRGDEIRPASAVTVLGRVLSDLRPLRDIRSGAEVVLEAKPC